MITYKEIIIAGVVLVVITAMINAYYVRKQTKLDEKWIKLEEMELEFESRKKNRPQRK